MAQLSHDGPVTGTRSLYHFVFFFDHQVAYPPTVDNIKSHYISREMLHRGHRVTWLQLGSGPATRSTQNGIEMVNLGSSHSRLLSRILPIIRAAIFFVSRRADCIYADEWLLWRHRPVRRLLFQVAFKLLGIRYVLDQRDPLIDFEVGSGRLKEGSLRHRVLVLAYLLGYSLTDLVVLSSSAYADDFASGQVPPKKLVGTVRGVDSSLFNPGVDGTEVRTALGLSDKFIIGWFGFLLPFRQVVEVLLPLMSNTAAHIPNAHFLIGGSGPLRREVSELQKSKPGVTFLGFIRYEELPRYLSACDVLLCPISEGGRLARNSGWLKVTEALAVGRPIIVTATRLREKDYSRLEGIIWAGSDYKSFHDSLLKVHANYRHYRELAMRQSLDFAEYNLETTMARIVNAVESILPPLKAPPASEMKAPRH